MAPKTTIFKTTKRGEVLYVVSHRTGGKRKRESFRTKTDAERRRSEITGEIAGLGAEWIALSADERQRLILAHREAQKRGLDLYALATAPASSSGPGLFLAVVIGEVVAAKEAAGRSKKYTKALAWILNQFQKSVGDVRINAVGHEQIERFHGFWFVFVELGKNALIEK